VQLLYLHGFASSARSSKATFLASRFASRGIEMRRPDLNEPDFATLTVSRMLGHVQHLLADLPPGPTTLVGSSLGGFVALHAAARAATAGSAARQVDRLILLAPALDFNNAYGTRLGDQGLTRWRETDRLDVYHHAYGRVLPVGFALYEDARQYDSFALHLELPMLVFHGRRDEIVDPAMVERFARQRPNVRLHMLDDGHQLQASLETIWQESLAFLGFPT
jgi:uncharacterized protein